MKSDVQKSCLVCRRSTDVTPLITLEYHDSQFWICPQHMPVLIHDPSRLVGLLPGAEGFTPARHDD